MRVVGITRLPGSLALLVACLAGSACSAERKDSAEVPIADTGPFCDTEWTVATSSDPVFSEVSRAANAFLRWEPEGFVLVSDAAEALGWYTRRTGPVDVMYDAYNTTSLFRLCESAVADGQCGVNMDCLDASSGTIHLVGEFSEFVDDNGDEACCEGELSVEMQSIAFDGGLTIEHLETRVFVEPYNSL